MKKRDKRNIIRKEISKSKGIYESTRKSTSGITLIALVVTIIILIILAGVSISVILGENGLIEKGKVAKEQTIVEREKEEISIAYGAAKTEKLTTDDSAVTSTDLQTEFTKNKTNATATGENPITVVFPNSGNIYIIDEYGMINKATELALNKTQLILQLKEGSTVTDEITAILTTISGEVIWTNSNDNVATIVPNGNKVTITALTIGETVITATCGEYTATCKVKIMTLEKGSFVEYNIAYEDVFYPEYNYTKYNGWRIINYTDNGDGTYSNVKIMSTGVPAQLYYFSNDTTTNKSWWVTDNIELENFKATIGNGFTFYNGAINSYYALQISAGMYKNFEDIKFSYKYKGDNLGTFKKIIINETTYDSNTDDTVELSGKIFNLYEKEKAEVRLITLLEMNQEIEGRTLYSTATIGSTYDKKGIYLLENIKNVEGMSDYMYSKGAYWLATPRPGLSSYGNVCSVTYFGIMNRDGYGKGVRPTICLKNNVQIVDENKDGVFEIKL